LFEPMAAGLLVEEDFIDPSEEHSLAGHIQALDLSPFRFQRWTGHRLTHSFGWRYDFEDASFRETEPIPGWLQPVREQAARLAEVEPAAIAHALITRYDPGAGIGWHRDRPVFDKVVGISLLSEAVLRFRQRTPAGFRRQSISLQPRSAYLLSDEVRREWEHSIAPGAELRLSITFRTLR